MDQYKPELGHFYGDSNPEVWVFQAERYFNFYGFSRDSWLSMPYVYFKGEARAWFDWLYRNDQFWDWNHFTEKLVIHYQNRPFANSKAHPKSKSGIEENCYEILRQLADLRDALAACTTKSTVNSISEDIRDVEEVADSTHEFEFSNLIAPEFENSPQQCDTDLVEAINSFNPTESAIQVFDENPQGDSSNKPSPIAPTVGELSPITIMFPISKLVIADGIVLPPVISLDFEKTCVNFIANKLFAKMLQQGWGSQVFADMSVRNFFEDIHPHRNILWLHYASSSHMWVDTGQEETLMQFGGMDPVIPVMAASGIAKVSSKEDRIIPPRKLDESSQIAFPFDPASSCFGLHLTTHDFALVQATEKDVYDTLQPKFFRALLFWQMSVNRSKNKYVVFSRSMFLVTPGGSTLVTCVWDPGISIRSITVPWFSMPKYYFLTRYTNCSLFASKGGEFRKEIKGGTDLALVLVEQLRSYPTISCGQPLSIWVVVYYSNKASKDPFTGREEFTLTLLRFSHVQFGLHFPFDPGTSLLKFAQGISSETEGAPSLVVFATSRTFDLRGVEIGMVINNIYDGTVVNKAIVKEILEATVDVLKLSCFFTEALLWFPYKLAMKMVILWIYRSCFQSAQLHTLLLRTDKDKLSAITSFSSILTIYHMPPEVVAANLQVDLWLVVQRLRKTAQLKIITKILLPMFLFQFLPKAYHTISLMRRMQHVAYHSFGQRVASCQGKQSEEHCSCNITVLLHLVMVKKQQMQFGCKALMSHILYAMTSSFQKPAVALNLSEHLFSKIVTLSWLAWLYPNLEDKVLIEGGSIVMNGLGRLDKAEVLGPGTVLHMGQGIKKPNNKLPNYHWDPG